jgi:hypothetical protein
MPYICYRAHCKGITIAELVARLKPAGITATQIGVDGRLYRFSTRFGNSNLLVCVNKLGRLYAITNDPASEGGAQIVLDAIRKAFDIKKIEKMKLQDGGDFFILENR